MAISRIGAPGRGPRRRLRGAGTVARGARPVHDRPPRQCPRRRRRHEPRRGGRPPSGPPRVGQPRRAVTGRAADPVLAPTTPTTRPGPWERRSGKVPGVQAGPGGLAYPRVPPGRPRSFRERVGSQSNAHFPSARSTGNLHAHGRTAHEGRRAGGRRTDRLPQRAGPGSPVSHGETNPSPLSAGGPVL